MFDKADTLRRVQLAFAHNGLDTAPVPIHAALSTILPNTRANDIAANVPQGTMEGNHLGQRAETEHPPTDNLENEKFAERRISVGPML